MKYVFIVEDDCKHVEDALRVRDELGLKDILEQAAGCDLYDFKRWLKEVVDTEEYKRKEVGVLTDLYFPPDSTHRCGRGELAPLGLMVMGECQRHGIPCVVITAGYHHGSKYEHIFAAIKTLDWPQMVDSNDPYGPEEAPRKNWEEAFKRLTTSGVGRYPA